MKAFAARLKFLQPRARRPGPALQRRASATPAIATAKPSNCTGESVSPKINHACTADRGGTASSSALVRVASPRRMSQISSVAPPMDSPSAE